MFFAEVKKKPKKVFANNKIVFIFAVRFGQFL